MHLMAYKNIKGSLTILMVATLLFYSCKTSSKASIEKVITAQRAIMPADSIIQKQKRGIDIIATGNDPVAWILEIDFDNMLSFKSADGNTLNILSAFSKKEITADFELYSTLTDLGDLVIKLYNEPCNGISGTNQLNRKASVYLKNKTYTGCGKYLYDHQLNDVWILENINNEKQTASDFAKGLPRLEFNLQTNKMNGSDGCNTINAGIEIKGSRIKFTAFSGTKMACKNNQVEKIFNEFLSNRSVDYYMKDGLLFLYLADDSRISFKRKEF